MDEKTTNYEIVKSLNSLGAWAYKIPDMPSSLMVGGRFNPDKPCDIISSVDGKFVGIESKQTKVISGFSIRLLRDIQIESLDAQVASNGNSFVFYNIRINKPRENRLIIFNWAKWRETLEVSIIPKKIIMDLPFVKGSAGMFALKDFCENVVGYGFGPEKYKDGLVARRIRKPV